MYFDKKKIISDVAKKLTFNNSYKFTGSYNVQIDRPITKMLIMDIDIENTCFDPDIDFTHQEILNKIKSIISDKNYVFLYCTYSIDDRFKLPWVINGKRDFDYDYTKAKKWISSIKSYINNDTYELCIKHIKQKPSLRDLVIVDDKISSNKIIKWTYDEIKNGNKYHFNKQFNFKEDIKKASVCVFKYLFYNNIDEFTPIWLMNVGVIINKTSHKPYRRYNMYKSIYSHNYYNYLKQYILTSKNDSRYILAEIDGDDVIMHLRNTMMMLKIVYFINYNWNGDISSQMRNRVYDSLKHIINKFLLRTFHNDKLSAIYTKYLTGGLDKQMLELFIKQYIKIYNNVFKKIAKKYKLLNVS